MKRFLAILLIFSAFSTAYGQKTAQEYFNTAAMLYAGNQTEAALYTVSRGCEIFEADSSLAQLKRLIEKDDNKKNQKQQNKNNQNNQGDQQNQDGQGQNGQQNGQQNNEQQTQQGNQETQQQGNQQQDYDKQEQGKESQSAQQGQQSESQPQGDKKGQISARQAEMMLDAIENNDKAVQQRLMLQKQNKKSNNKIEKNW
ncbi:MAG: hypothetical protein J6Y55_02810 [Bacteroidales bacterium]|nr:hypothetical protein [Bacteroidales bacterium]